MIMHIRTLLFDSPSRCLRIIICSFTLTQEYLVSSYLQADANIVPQGMIDLSSAYEVVI